MGDMARAARLREVGGGEEFPRGENTLSQIFTEI